ncbi:hypothetical protein NVP1084O_229 [Vibrio phage 1.084.O._10N.261.49.F5]|nr:hypothetical protein NVP1084O_229 [Vibrio phage 1.084.O._10N.261.49.F5]
MLNLFKWFKKEMCEHDKAIVLSRVRKKLAIVNIPEEKLKQELQKFVTMQDVLKTLTKKGSLTLNDGELCIRDLKKHLDTVKRMEILERDGHLSKSDLSQKVLKLVTDEHGDRTIKVISIN